MTLTDPKTEYSPCPWCGQPGRLMSRQTNYSHTKRKWYFAYSIGCRNPKCPMKPRTPWISKLDDSETAIYKCKWKWENRACT